MCVCVCVTPPGRVATAFVGGGGGYYVKGGARLLWDPPPR